jgi:hypothetical protein
MVPVFQRPLGLAGERLRLAVVRPLVRAIPLRQVELGRCRAYWSPGYVGWSISADEVSWVPLGHNEVYYGYGNFGPANVNVAVQASFRVTNVYVNSRVSNGVVMVGRDNFLRGKVVREQFAALKNPFRGVGSGGVKIIGKSPVLEIRPLRETRQPRPDVEVKRMSLPPVILEKASRTIRTRVVAPTKEKSVFNPGNRPATLKNVVKGKDLEQWVAPPPAVRAREVQQPAGKREFKRILSPRGETEAAPIRVLEPKDDARRTKENPPDGENSKNGKERGSGKEK